ncbi:unnamed protein product [Protopolystoma xenopodis]|uniref:Uncharacterized protein n=1 Tax=Protopolystoma xenopodis TaxID=117903 RepID=A0A3S5BG30_9PLAT|nr:unnamed protein product [Protopolystoma xenopodis]
MPSVPLYSVALCLCVSRQPASLGCAHIRAHSCVLVCVCASNSCHPKRRGHKKKHPEQADIATTGRKACYEPILEAVGNHTHSPHI